MVSYCKNQLSTPYKLMEEHPDSIWVFNENDPINPFNCDQYIPKPKFKNRITQF